MDVLNVTNFTELEVKTQYVLSIPEKIAQHIMWPTTIAAIIGNSLLLLVFSQRNLLKVHDMLIATLSCLDLVHAFMNIFNYYFMYKIHDLFPKFNCFLNNFMYHFVLLSSCFTLIEITIDRLLAVCNVMFHRIHATKKRCYLTIACTQLLVGFLVMPSAGICVDGARAGSKIYMYVTHFLVGSGTCVVMGVSYFNIWATVKRQAKAWAAQNKAAGTNRGTGDNNHGRGDGEKSVRPTESFPLCSTTSTGHTAINTSNKEKKEQKGLHKSNFIEDDVKVKITPNSDISADCNNQNLPSTSTTTTEVATSTAGRLHVPKSTSLRSISSRLNKDGGNTTTRDASRGQGSKTTRLCICICVIYISLTMPNITTQLLFHAIPTLSKNATMSDVYIVAYMLSLLNTVSNPFVYALIHKTFCAEMKSIWSRISKFILKIACFHQNNHEATA
ncbi:uncharacterized protein LOC134848525 [Symsagittifera roscoffensis]|uniref:uncharacterized protein LOC134848525 n=1 Tax=Symsagittifera roscoffensis TaxID=84072 RepID=UPI00307C9094